jgi:hypothetical protein
VENTHNVVHLGGKFIFLLDLNSEKQITNVLKTNIAQNPKNDIDNK